MIKKPCSLSPVLDGPLVSEGGGLMIRSVVIVWCTVVCIATSAQASVCLPPKVEKESPYRYVLTLADALSYAKSALDRAAATQGPSVGNFELLLALKLGKADLECAESQVAPFVGSLNKPIKLSAQVAAAVFSQLAKLQQRSVDEHKTLLDSIAAGQVKPGTVLERQAELVASYDEAWKNLIPAVIASTYALIEIEPATGLMSRLGLTRAQRDEILKALTSTFGNAVTGGMKAGQIPLIAAASALYQVVGDPKWKLRDSR